MDFGTIWKIHIFWAGPPISTPDFVPEKLLPLYLHLLKTVAAIPTSTQCRLPPYLHLLNAIPTSTRCRLPPCLHLLNAGCRHTYIYSMPVAAKSTFTQKKGGNVFRFMKLEESMAGEVSESAGRCYELGGTHFTIRNIKFRWKFRTSKGPESE